MAPEDASPLGRSRAEVLDILRGTDGPLGVREVAQRMGLHPNTARFHLEALVEGGLAVRETEDRETRGRPRIGYRAATDFPAGRRRYRLLAEMLTSLIAGIIPEPGRAAEEAGREWGAYLTEQPPPYRRLTAEEAVEQLTVIMEELGFAPQAEAGDREGQYRLCLRRCPFREVAEHHRDVICALHLGLMRGALARMRAPVTADRLDPLVEPSLCVSRLEILSSEQKTMASDQPLPEQGGPSADPLRAATWAPSPGGNGEAGDGGDPACWARLVCQECGAVVSEGHLAGCSFSSRVGR